MDLAAWQSAKGDQKQDEHHPDHSGASVLFGDHDSSSSPLAW